VTSTINPSTSASKSESKLRLSTLLRDILDKNPNLQTFSIERILSTIGSDRPEASLMMLSIPGIVPVPSPNGIVSAPTGAIGYQLFSGQKKIRIPRFVLKKSVSRRALAVAIHTILPLLEAAEKVMRPRWNWMSHASARRAIGLFVFLLAVAIAFPLFGFSPLHATSIFVMALGMAEQDGLVVLVGVAIGVLSLVVLGVSGMSVRALKLKASKWLQRVARKLGFQAFARYLRGLGYRRLARLLTLEWSHLLLIWNPEKKTSPNRPKVVSPHALTSPAPLSPHAAISLSGRWPAIPVGREPVMSRA
jgi:hypothetical protein